MRNRWWWLGVLLMAGCEPSGDPAGSGAGNPPGATSTAPYQVRTVANLPYIADANAAHALDLYLPTHKKGEPLLIFVHGGAWIGGDKNGFDSVGIRFAVHDRIAVAIPNYRLANNGAVRHPGPVRDIAAAYKWLVLNAGKYGYDSKRIFVCGHSAGAHNAGMLATGDFLRAEGIGAAAYPAGFIGIEGIYDLPTFDRDFPSYKAWFLAHAFGDLKGWRAASPARRKVQIRSPWLVIQSTQDQLVNATQSKLFVSNLEGQGVKAEYWEKPLHGHDTVIANLANATDVAASKIATFVLGNSSR